MVNYTDTKIYRIRVGEENYYGHTTQALYKRKSERKKSLKNGKQQKVYQAMREVGMGEEDIELVLVEKYPCKDAEEARARERYYIELDGKLNMNIPNRTQKEGYKAWKEAHKEEVLQKDRERGKIYRQNNKEKLNEKLRKYRQQNKDKVKEWKKKGYEKNREKILEARRKYYEEHRDEENAKQRERRALTKAQI